MKKIAKNLMTSTQFTNETERPPDLIRSMRVWVQLGEIFSKAFYRETGTEPTPLWAQAITRLTDAQISNGLANLGNDGLKFPPNLSMFIAACKREKPVRRLGVRAIPLSDADKIANADKAWANMERLAGRKLRSNATNKPN